ncbi:MAG: sigma-54 dependent transcriptional regulator [Bacteroidales bacterium]|nr:sigma-54 dependent transcriptional regulator [Bacteroidales bacterium]
MILIVDDDASITLSLSLLLKRVGYKVKTAASPSQAADIVREQAPQLILMDMNFTQYATSGEEGLTLLRQLKLFVPSTPIILMSAWGSIPLAVKGMRLGAFDFITKPMDTGLLLQRIATALELSAHKGEETHGDKTLDRKGIIGKSQALEEVLSTVERIAPTNASVLILGENGTGKELIAQAIHRNSQRSSGPMVMVNLGGISQSLFESEMFGHKKGAFTGAIADRQGRFDVANHGTIFLDEIGDLDLSCQVKLLRVLQSQTFEPLGDSTPHRVDVRVVSATNAPLEEMVAAGTFREDLFYRINLITLRLPPLRERREDIPLLVDYFMRDIARRHHVERPEVSAEAMRYLAGLPFPGNIRQLRNVVERTLLVNHGKRRLEKEDFPEEAEAPEAKATSQGSQTLADVERRAIEAAMEKYKGNLTQVAAALGITRQSLYRRLEKLKNQ